MDSSGCRVGLHGGMEAEEEDESRSEPSAISTEQEAASGTDSGQMSEGRTSAGSKVRTGAQRRRARAPSEAVSPVEAKLEAALERARTYAREGQAAEGVAELVRCVALSRVLFGDGHWRLAQAYTDLAHAYLHLRGLASQARQHAETARRILLCGTLFAPSVQEKLDILHTLFSMYCTLGKATAQLKHLKESEQNLMKAEKILEELQESKLDVSEVVQLEVELITTQGRLYVQQGKATQAVLLLERSLKLMQSLVSTDGAQIIEAHRWLVRAHQLCSNHEAAIEISLQAKAIAGSSFGPGSTKVAQVIHTLGQAYTCTGNTEHEGLAEQNLLESLSMYKQAGLAESSRALAVLDDLCHLHVHMKKYQEAFERLRSSMGMKREVFGECSEKVAETFHLMGAIRMAQGELPSAYRLMKKCLDIQSILYGPQHKKTKATKETLDTLSRCPGVVAKRNAPKADPSRRHLAAAVEKQKPPK